MKANTIIVDYATKHDFKTIQDRRTSEREHLIRQVNEMKIKHYNSVYGIWCYLSVNDISNFLTFNNN